MSRINLVSKNLLANYSRICQQIIFAIVATEIIDEKIMTNSFTNIAKITKVTRCTPVELFQIKVDTIGH